MVAPDTTPGRAEVSCTNGGEKLVVRDYLLRLFEPMTDSEVVTFYGESTGARNRREADLSGTWTRQLVELRTRSLDDDHFRATSAELLRDIELALAERWLRDRFESRLPLAAMFHLDRSKVDIESEVSQFLAAVRDIDMHMERPGRRPSADRRGEGRARLRPHREGIRQVSAR